MSNFLRRHGALLGCLALSAVSLVLPMRGTSPQPPEPPQPPPPPVEVPTVAGIGAETTLRVGSAATVRVALGSSLVAADTSVPVAVGLDINGLAADASAPRAVVLVIDRSGSMSGSPIRHARDAAEAMVDQLGAQDEIAIVTFGTSPTLEMSLRRADGAGRAAALSVIRGITARGATHLSGGLSLAAHQVSLSSAPIKRVVLLSDGMPTEGDVSSAGILSLARLSSRRGAAVTTFGVGIQSPGSIMERIAATTSGNFRYVRDSHALRAALQAELDDSRRIALRDAHLRVELPAGASMVSATGVQVERQAGQLDVALGDILVGTPRRALLMLQLPATAQGNRVLFQLEARGASGSTVYREEGRIAATASNDAGAVVRSGITWVQEQEYVADASEAVRRAAVQFDKGDRDEGARMMQVATRKLEEASARMPALEQKAKRMRAAFDEVQAAPAASAGANAAYEESFRMAR